MNALTAHLPALQVIVPMLMAPFVVLLRARNLPWVAATATSLLAFSIAVRLTMIVTDGKPVSYRMGSWAPPYGIELQVDALSALVLLVVTGASSLALIGGRESLAKVISADREPYFFAAWLLALAGMAGIVVSADAFNIFVFMEISSLSMSVLIALGRDKRALVAAEARD